MSRKSNVKNSETDQTDPTIHMEINQAVQHDRSQERLVFQYESQNEDDKDYTQS